MIPFVADPDFTLYVGDALKVLRSLPDESATACVTSPPYLDARPEYDSPSVLEFADVFEQLARVVTDGCLVNVGRLWKKGVEQLWWLELLRVASYSGWCHLDTKVWSKPNANPIRGQVFADSHEYVLVLGRPGCRLNEDAIRTPYTDESIARMDRTWRNGRGVKGDVRGEQASRALHPLGARPRSVVTVYVGRDKGNPHPAPMALELAEHLVALASWPGQTVIDPFAGSGTTSLAARRLGRLSIAIEKSAEYARVAADRLSQLPLMPDESKEAEAA